MAGPGFTQTFGGTVLYPAQSTYNNLALTQSITLLWPTELSLAGSPVVADIMDVTASAPGLSIAFSDATLASTGYTALFNNIGATTFAVLNSVGGNLVNVASGQAWLVYLADNSTPAGVWRVFQMGAGVSSANAASLAGAGLEAITTTLNAFVTIQTHNANYVSTVADRAQMIEWTGGVGTITLEAAGTAGTGWFCYIKNSGSGSVTVSPPTGLIDGQASVAFAVNNSAIVVCDGVNYFTIGFGQTINSIFSFLQISLTGLASPLVLSGAQLNRISYKFTGVLTGNFVVVVPATVQQYWIDNETTGAFTLSFESPTPGTITAVGQTQRNILYCDGVNVVPAVTFASTGFANGSNSSPSIFFTASPGTGIYSPVPNFLDFATSGVLRLQVDSTGKFFWDGPDNALAAGFTFNQSSFGAGVTMKVVTPFSSGATTPLLQLQSIAAGGFALLSLCGNGVNPGTTDLALLQDGSANAVLINRGAGSLTLTTQSPNLIFLNGVASFGFTGANSVVIGSAATNSVGFTNTTAATATSGGATLPANPVGFLTVNVNGIAQRIPYYNP